MFIPPLLLFTSFTVIYIVYRHVWCLLLFTLFTAEETGYDVSCVIPCLVLLFTVIYIVYFRGNWLWCQLRDLVPSAADAGPRVSHTAGLRLTRAAGVGSDGTPLPATKSSGAGSWRWTGQLLGLVWWWVAFTVAQAWTEVPGSFDSWFCFSIVSSVHWGAGTVVSLSESSGICFRVAFTQALAWTEVPEVLAACLTCLMV